MDLDQFVTDVYLPAKIRLSSGTVYQIRRTVAAYARHLGRAPTTADLDLDPIRRFLSAYAQNHKAATVNSKRSQLIALWRCARRELPDAPKVRAKSIRRLPDDSPPPEAWTIEEFRRLLDLVRRFVHRRISDNHVGGLLWADWWESILLVCYDTGERRNAILATRSRDLDMSAGWIRFYRRKGRPRICGLSDDTLAACRKIYSPSRDLLWPWPYTQEALSAQFRAIVRRAGLPRSKSLFHQIRRTTGSIVEQQGGDGARAIGDTRAVFERHYLDPRFVPSDLEKLPRP